VENLAKTDASIAVCIQIALVVLLASLVLYLVILVLGVNWWTHAMQKKQMQLVVRTVSVSLIDMEF